jgi:hypothetical protein
VVDLCDTVKGSAWLGSRRFRHSAIVPGPALAGRLTAVAANFSIQPQANYGEERIGALRPEASDVYRQAVREACDDDLIMRG